MLRFTTVLALVLTAGFVAAQDEVPVQGNWQGEFTSSDWQSKSLRAQIVGESWDRYRAVLYVGKDGADEQSVVIKGKTTKEVTHFEGRVDLGSNLGGGFTVTGKAAKGVFKGTFKGQGSSSDFELKRVLLKSPTLGVKPPEGAIVLLDDSNKTFQNEWNIPDRWVWLGNGAVSITGSSLISKKTFGDAQYHIEFRTPYMPGDSGQGRGNSGVYVQGRYEVQVLDSFTDAPMDNLCGGIYQLAVPITNACLPPTEWQTYDITFRAPRFDASGKKTQDAQITVEHNGTLIHDKVKLPRTTPGGVTDKEGAAGPLLLQDHSDRVEYINVWVKPLD